MSNEVENIWDPADIRNMDVVGVCERIDRIMYEMSQSESAKLNSLEEYDIERIIQYNAALRIYVSTVNEANRMDLPHSYPAMYSIKYICSEGNIDYESTKNRIIRDLQRLYANMLVQWSRSESADKSNGFYEADYNRFILIMDRIDGYISSYIKEATPLDLPESSTYEDSING